MHFGTEISADRGGTRARIGFTLVELLTVVAIIMLLIGILVPTLSKAREHAKKASTRAMFKAISDGLEMFRNENPKESQGGDGYPSSAVRDDPTEDQEQWLFGAQWVVRYLMGANLDGYIPRRLVPRDVIAQGTPLWEQRDWYATEPTSYNPHAPLQRVGPYLQADTVRIEAPANLDGAPAPGQLSVDVSLTAPVFLDSFGYPALYYSANTRLAHALQAEAPVAGFGNPSLEDPEGIYAFSDNGLFTGTYKGSTEAGFPPWDFVGAGVAGQKLKDFGVFAGGVPDPNDIATNVHTFPYYILNKDVYESSQHRTAVPYRRDSFILISPGADGIYGTEDDVTNF